MEYLLSSKTSHTICDAIYGWQNEFAFYITIWDCETFVCSLRTKASWIVFAVGVMQIVWIIFFCVCCTLDCCWGKFNRRINWDISTLNFCVFFFYRHHLPLFYNGSATAALEVHSAQTHTQKKMRSTFRTFFLILHTKYMCRERYAIPLQTHLHVRSSYFFSFSSRAFYSGSGLNSMNNCSTQCVHLKRKCNLQILVHGKVPYEHPKKN